MNPYKVRVHSSIPMPLDPRNRARACGAVGVLLVRAQSKCNAEGLLLQVHATGPECWCRDVRDIMRAGAYRSHGEWEGYDGEPDAVIVWGEKPSGVNGVPSVRVKYQPREE